MKTADVSRTHSQQHQTEQSTSSAPKQEQSFFSEQSSAPTPFFPSAGIPGIQAKSSGKPFFQPSRIPAIQAKCATCIEEEKNQREEGAGALPEVQKMSTSGDDSGEDTNVIQPMPAFESDEAPVQTKLTIGEPGDKYEQEADSMADRVMAMPEPGAKRIETHSKVSIQRFYFPSTEASQQKSLDGKHILQTKGQNDSAGTSPTLENRLNTSKGRGTPLSKETRTFMGNRFGQDFSAVRVHTGSESVQMNKDLGAQAFTHKQDVYFGAGKYSPESNSGKRLLAHELTHVVQQTGSRVQRNHANKQNTNISLKPKTLSQAERPTIQRLSWGSVWNATGGRVVSGAKYVGGKVASGARYVGGKVASGAKWVGGKAADAFMWIYHKIKGVVTKGIDWVKNRWNALKSFASSGLKTIKNIFNFVVQFVKSPLSLLSNAIMNMDVESIRQTWGSFTQLVLSVWDGFHKTGMGLLSSVGALWKKISGYASSTLSRAESLTKHWAFKKLPSSIRNLVYRLIGTLRNLWNRVSTWFNSKWEEIKTFVDNAFKVVRGFVERVLSFAIDKIITGIILFGKVLVFVRDLLKNPEKYLKPLAKKIAGYLNRVEGGFSAQINKYFGNAGKSDTTNSANSSFAPSGVVQKKDDPSATARDSATWAEIGDGVWEIMQKKWAEVKKNPLTIILKLLRDLVFPYIGHAEDLVKLFKDIKKIVTKPFRASSLEDLWTSLLHFADIPILLYNTFWSIVGRQLGLALIVASFIPHPVVKGIAVVAGYALLAAMITGELANLSQKILLLKTGNTSDDEKKDAYNSVSDSLIAFSMEIAMAVIMLIVSAVGNIVKGIFNFIKGKVFKPKASTKSSPDVDTKGPKVEGEGSRKQKTSSEDGQPTLETTKNREGKLTQAEVEAEFAAFKDGQLKRSSDPKYEWEIELPNGHTWKRKKNGKWCRASQHCFDEELPLKNDREFYEHLKREGLVKESFEDFMDTKPGEMKSKPHEDTGVDVSEQAKAGEKTKPSGEKWKQTPNWEKWTKSGGTIKEHPDGSVTLIAKDGTRVKYTSDGYPDFRPHLDHPSGVKEVPIEGPFSPMRTPDYKKANVAAGHPEWGNSPPRGYRWHHHQDGITMQLVPERIHTMFRHSGGVANLQ